jgi:E3 ubiquitin-protein ligase UBR1
LRFVVVVVVVVVVVAGLWIRNGASIFGQTHQYKARSLRQYTFELDLALIQMACCLMPPTQFLITLLHRFELLEWFTKSQFQLNRQKTRQLSQSEKENQQLKLGMCEELLYLV